MKDKAGFLWDFLSQTALHPGLGLLDICELVYWFWSETDEKSLKGFMIMKKSAIRLQSCGVAIQQ